MDSDTETNFDLDDFPATQNEYYARFPRIDYGWIYIAIDIRDLHLTKIGRTTRERPESRIAQGRTYNPFLMLFTTYDLSKCSSGISQKELNDIEGYIHNRSVFGAPIGHLTSRRESEWFRMHPEAVENEIDAILAARGFRVDGKTLFNYYNDANNLNDIHVPRMRKIKKIFRPYTENLCAVADRCGIPFALYKPYYDYLYEYHSGPEANKRYF